MDKIYLKLKGVINMSIDKSILTEEKVWKLKPIIERILSRKYGREIEFINLTIGDITISTEDQNAKLRSHK